MPIAHDNHFDLVRNCLGFDVLKRPAQNMCALVRGDDDAEGRPGDGVDSVQRTVDSFDVIHCTLSSVHLCMQNLYLDVASHASTPLSASQGCIACVTDDRVLRMTPIDHRIDDAELIPLIEQTVKDAGWSYKDLTHIACVTGPGGFTSLRVGVSAANALVYALKVPVCGVHLSDLYAARTDNSQLTTDKLLWVHSTKKKELFIRRFGDNARSAFEAECISIDALSSFVKSGDEWMGELIPEQEKVMTELGAKRAALTPLQEVLPSLLKNQRYEKKTLLPWYGREG